MLNFSAVLSQRFSQFTPIIPCADERTMCFVKMALLCYGACVFVRDFCLGLSQFTRDGVDVQNGR